MEMTRAALVQSAALTAATAAFSLFPAPSLPVTVDSWSCSYAGGCSPPNRSRRLPLAGAYFRQAPTSSNVVGRRLPFCRPKP